MRSRIFLVVALAVAAAVFVVARLIGSEYLFFAGYVVLQFVVLATAWNILGGYCGYVNFGSAAFFAVGAYTTVFFNKTYPLPIPVLILLGGVISGIIGFGMGYLTLRLRGAFFAIATLALAVVLQTLIVNWQYVGGSRGAYAIRPATIDIAGIALPYMQYLFALMLILSVAAICIARLIERSRLGYGFATIRDDELAAEACGVPTLRLKLTATTISGGLMGMAGAPFPYYISYIEPSSAFGLAYAVNSIAMPMIGGTGTWIGPLVGALLLGSIQEIARVTISSAVNLLIVGVLLVTFVVMAPNGIVGLVNDFLRATASRSRQIQIGVIAVAGLCFLLGILEVLAGIPWLSAAASGRTPAIAGGAALALGICLLGCAYALLTLQHWAPKLTATCLALSVVGVVSSYYAGLLGTGNERLLMLGGIVVVIAVSFVIRPGTRSIYEGSVKPAVSPAVSGSP
jgi:branched-chain amino acid transport system permease protein